MVRRRVEVRLGERPGPCSPRCSFIFPTTEPQRRDRRMPVEGKDERAGRQRGIRVGIRANRHDVAGGGERVDHPVDVKEEGPWTRCLSCGQFLRRDRHVVAHRLGLVEHGLVG